MPKESSRVDLSKDMPHGLLMRYKDSRANSLEWNPKGFISWLKEREEEGKLGDLDIEKSIFLWAGVPVKSFCRFLASLAGSGLVPKKRLLRTLFSRKVAKRFLKAIAVRHPGLPNYLARAHDFDRSLARALSRLSPRNIHLFWLELPVTTSCNMSCKYCIPMSGLFGHGPENRLTKEDVISTLEMAGRVVKDVAFLRIVGGEPLLCPFLEDVLKSVPNGFAGQIRIVTNGTVVPGSDGFWKTVKETGADFEVSDYPFRQPLVDYLEDNRIPYVYLSDRRWRDYGLPGTLPPGRKASKRQLFNCGTECRQAIRGRLNYCSRVSFAQEYGLAPRFGEGHAPGSVDLAQPDAAQKILEMELAPGIPDACGQCLNGTGKAAVVPNGAQQVRDAKGPA